VPAGHRIAEQGLSGAGLVDEIGAYAPDPGPELVRGTLTWKRP
jgi:hypothetical protein